MKKKFGHLGQKAVLLFKFWLFRGQKSLCGHSDQNAFLWVKKIGHSGQKAVSWVKNDVYW